MTPRTQKVSSVTVFVDFDVAVTADPDLINLGELRSYLPSLWAEFRHTLLLDTDVGLNGSL